eukprot:3576265-Pyramimonas_sp.AAC.1
MTTRVATHPGIYRAAPHQRLPPHLPGRRPTELDQSTDQSASQPVSQSTSRPVRSPSGDQSSATRRRRRLLSAGSALTKSPRPIGPA